MKENLQEIFKKFTYKGFTTGKKRPRFYVIWEALNRRCNTPSQMYYENYGGRGIKCEWKDFEEFFLDMYIPYREHCDLHGENDTSIDRIDSDGNYCKSNCRWATRTIQNRNTKANRILTFNGESMCCTQWAEKLNMHPKALFSRLYKGWTIEETLTTPVRAY